MVEAVFLRNISGYYANIDSSGNVFVNATVTATANISGQPITFASGASAQLSGVNVIVQSGLAIVGNFSAQVSGQPISVISGSINVGSKVINSNLSGAYVITGSSGGLPLFSGGPLISATLRNASGNAIMWVGGAGTNAPATNIGMDLYANESVTLTVGNFNDINVMASISGQALKYIGLQL